MGKKYFGKETSKAIENFGLSGVPVDLSLIRSLVLVKIALADANLELGRLDKKRHTAIVTAAGELLAGKFDDQFPTDAIQGGAGTSINMNVNEVLAARAAELLKSRLPVHPLDHVNMGHSTNDAVPAAFRITLAPLLDKLLLELAALEKSFRKKSREFTAVLKVGRTHLQDAVPITLGQEFGAYAALVSRDRQRLREFKKYLYQTNLGGTAIGTGLNSSRQFIKLANRNLSRLSRLPLRPAPNLIDNTQNLDTFLHLAALLQVSAAGLHKVVNDLRLMASGPRAGLSEIILPERQIGSSIMPGKINPVILESFNQIFFVISGNAEVASLVIQNGQFELNVMLPVLIKSLLESFTLLTAGVKNLRTKAVDGIKADRKNCQKHLREHLGKATALISRLGYDQAAILVKRASKNGCSLEEEITKSKLLSPRELSEIFSPQNLTRPRK